MKLMFASDIHGCSESCALMLERFDEEKADKLFLLGDILYHGPRNEPPAAYAPKKVAAMLNERKEKLFCVRGNCEAEVDQMMLEFPVMAEYALIFLDGRTVFLTHGHKFNTQDPPLLQKGDILINGHTHIQTIDDSREYLYINTGSVSLPKSEDPKGYAIYENGEFFLKLLENGDIRKGYKIR